MEKLDPYAALLGRLLLSVMFIVAGINKIMGGGEGTIEYMAAAGVPGFLFWPAALFEVVAGLMILAGYQTRIVAYLLAGFCLVTAFVFHAGEGAMMMKNITIAGGFLILARFGAGEFSVDGKAEGNA